MPVQPRLGDKHPYFFLAHVLLFTFLFRLHQLDGHAVGALRPDESYLTLRPWLRLFIEEGHAGRSQFLELAIDIVDLDGASVREILKMVDKNDLMLALKSSADELKEKFYANMSQRAKDAFIEEMQFLGAVKVKEVESAQRKIVEAVQALAEQGVLQLGESEEMVE